MDPPDHTRLRRLVSQAFTPRALESMRPRIQQLVDELLDAIEGKDEMDAIADLAYPLPVSVICEMLGVPREDEPQFRVWSRILASSLDPDISVTPEALKERERAIFESREYFRELIARRGDDRPPDILSALLTAEEEGDKLSERELLSTCTMILIAGHETTVNLIGNGILQLLRHPDQLAKFQERPEELAPHAVEEVLRFDPPVQFDGRICIQQTEVGGVTLTGALRGPRHVRHHARRARLPGGPAPGVRFWHPLLPRPAARPHRGRARPAQLRRALPQRPPPRRAPAIPRADHPPGLGEPAGGAEVTSSTARPLALRLSKCERGEDGPHRLHPRCATMTS